jgi:hypothetical protein
LFDRTRNDRTAACFYLADHPSEKARMEDLLFSLVYSHLPLTLLWPRDFSIPANLNTYQINPFYLGNNTNPGVPTNYMKNYNRHGYDIWTNYQGHIIKYNNI